MPARGEAQHRDGKSQESAAHVPHENTGGRPVPNEKPKGRAGQCQHRRRQSAFSAEAPVEQRPGTRDEDSLAACDAVDAVHEVEQVGEPDQRYQAEQAARPDSMQPHMFKRRLSDAADDDDRQSRSNDVDANANARGQCLAIVQIPGQCDGTAAGDEHKSDIDRQQSRQRTPTSPARPEGRDDREAAAARGRRRVRTSYIRYVHDRVAQRIPPGKAGGNPREERR